METIAVYWEEQVKVYGISDKVCLVAVKLSFTADLLEAIGGALQELEQQRVSFDFINSLQASDECFEMHLLTGNQNMPAIEEWRERLLTNFEPIDCTIIEPVDSFFLHGPHFQDRYGIAEKGFGALAEQQIRLYLSGCTGTSMYLITESGKKEMISEILGKTFLVPKTVQPAKK